MAMTNCKECKQQISTKADTCPNCGASTKSKGIGCGATLVVLIGVVIIVGMFAPDTGTNSTAPQTPEQRRKAQVEQQFSAWDGAHRGVERAVKQNLKDPDSYKHVETRYIDNGDHLMVYTTFRGTNSFGAVVTNSATAKTDLQGNVLSLSIDD